MDYSLVFDFGLFVKKCFKKTETENSILWVFYYPGIFGWVFFRVDIS